MFRAGHDVRVFPIGENVDLQCYDKADKDFLDWLQDCVKNRHDFLKDKTVPSLQLWHLNGSEVHLGSKPYLLTFYECDSPTEQEVGICSQYKKVFFSSKSSQSYFKDSGVSNTLSFKLGFDEDFYKIDREYMPNVLHFGLIGKWENRKNTKKIIRTWVRKYGNNKDYSLTCLVDNPFFDANLMAALKNEALGGKRFFNVTFLPRLSTNSEVNDLINSIDIDLSGLSSAEGWNLPAFNATCLGKWSCVTNVSAHKDWATASNCILVECDKKIEAYDGQFFQKGQFFNQGNFYEVPEETIAGAMDLAEKTAGIPNKKGERLKEKFTYAKSLESILSHIK